MFSLSPLLVCLSLSLCYYSVPARSASSTLFILMIGPSFTPASFRCVSVTSFRVPSSMPRARSRGRISLSWLEREKRREWGRERGREVKEEWRRKKKDRKRVLFLLLSSLSRSLSLFLSLFSPYLLWYTTGAEEVRPGLEGRSVRGGRGRQRSARSGRRSWSGRRGRSERTRWGRSGSNWLLSRGAATRRREC